MPPCQVFYDCARRMRAILQVILQLYNKIRICYAIVLPRARLLSAADAKKLLQLDRMWYIMFGGHNRIRYTKGYNICRH